MAKYNFMCDGETQSAEFDSFDAAYGKAVADLISGQAVPVSVEDGGEVHSLEQLCDRARKDCPQLQAQVVQQMVASSQRHRSKPVEPPEGSPEADGRRRAEEARERAVARRLGGPDVEPGGAPGWARGRGFISG